VLTILDDEEGQQVEGEENIPYVPLARSKVNAHEFAAFRLHVRKDTHNRGGIRILCLARLIEE
jgi:predicted transcriptional regulator